ncbi:hypothetical protein C2E23DRAFT_824710 [Lenzites betulinus]|nr:hypothetical protein C2E23DRAFT_824710 [Lenzites betulinus]
MRSAGAPTRRRAVCPSAADIKLQLTAEICQPPATQHRFAPERSRVTASRLTRRASLQRRGIRDTMCMCSQPRMQSSTLIKA